MLLRVSPPCVRAYERVNETRIIRFVRGAIKSAVPDIASTTPHDYSAEKLGPTVVADTRLPRSVSSLRTPLYGTRLLPAPRARDYTATLSLSLSCSLILLPLLCLPLSLFLSLSPSLSRPPRAPRSQRVYARAFEARSRCTRATTTMRYRCVTQCVCARIRIQKYTVHERNAYPRR